jgi:homoaconitase/3-isopropylmalate dehydratase large subunit
MLEMFLKISMEGRMTVCIEMGARGGMIAPTKHFDFRRKIIRSKRGLEKQLHVENKTDTDAVLMLN